MGGAFERLAKSVLNRLGQDAFLVSGASTTPCRANVEHGVQVAGAYDDAVFNRDVATIDRALVATMDHQVQIKYPDPATIAATIRATGRPRRVMETSSPSTTAASNSESRVLAS